MRILHIITNTDLGGAQKVLLDLTSCAVKENNIVAVASMKTGPMWAELDKNIKCYFLDNMIKEIKLQKEIKCFFEIKKIIKDFNPDIIHLHCSKAGLIGRLAAGKYKKKVVYTIHGFDQIRIAHKKYLILEKLFKNHCGAIVAVSDYDLKNLRKEKIINKVHYIPNSVSILNKKQKIPQFFLDCKNQNQFVIMSIARLAAPKRPDIFIKVADLLINKYKLTNCKFVWIGGKTDVSLNKLLPEDLNSTNVTFLGDYPNASLLIPYCNLFCLFSNHEGMPMSILEAMSYSKPILASNVGGITELIDNNGFLIDMYNNNTLFSTNEIADTSAKIIYNLLNNSNLLKEYSSKSYELYNSKYNVSIMWNKYKDLYNSLI